MASWLQVVSTGKVTRDDRDKAWNELQRAAKEKKTRPFYRAVNTNGLMLAGNNDILFYLRVQTKMRFYWFVGSNLVILYAWYEHKALNIALTVNRINALATICQHITR